MMVILILGILLLLEVKYSGGCVLFVVGNETYLEQEDAVKQGTDYLPTDWL